MVVKDNANSNIFNIYVKYIGSLSDIEITGSLINQGIPFSVLAKCLQFF